MQVGKTAGVDFHHCQISLRVCTYYSRRKNASVPKSYGHFLGTFYHMIIGDNVAHPG